MTNEKWQWSKSQSENGSYTDIDRAEMMVYEPTTPWDGDIGYYLRATVSYTDGAGLRQERHG